MFDIYCAHCGEPWEQDMLHDLAFNIYKRGTL